MAVKGIWMIERHSGQNRPSRVFALPEADARKRFDKIKTALRRGGVWLYDESQSVVDCTWAPTLHERLIAKQSDEELRRKERKSAGKHTNQFWSQEELDVADREAERLVACFAQK